MPAGARARLHLVVRARCPQRVGRAGQPSDTSSGEGRGPGRARRRRGSAGPRRIRLLLRISGGYGRRRRPRRRPPVASDVGSPFGRGDRRRAESQQPLRGRGRTERPAQPVYRAVLGLPSTAGVTVAVHAQGARFSPPHGRGRAPGVPPDGAAAPIAGIPCVLRLAAARRRKRGQPGVARHPDGRGVAYRLGAECSITDLAVHDRLHTRPDRRSCRRRRVRRDLARTVPVDLTSHPYGTPPKCSACAITSPPSIVRDGWRRGSRRP